MTISEYYLLSGNILQENEILFQSFITNLQRWHMIPVNYLQIYFCISTLWLSHKVLQNIYNVIFLFQFFCINSYPTLLSEIMVYLGKLSCGFLYLSIFWVNDCNILLRFYVLHYCSKILITISDFLGRNHCAVHIFNQMGWGLTQLNRPFLCLHDWKTKATFITLVGVVLADRQHGNNHHYISHTTQSTKIVTNGKNHIASPSFFPYWCA